MIRITRGNVAAKRRKKFLKLAKGYTGSNSKLSTFAAEQVIQSLQFAYKSRRLNKRTFKSIWIARINAFLQAQNLKYSLVYGLLKKANIFLNRKNLAFLAFQDQPVLNTILRILTEHFSAEIA